MNRQQSDRELRLKKLLERELDAADLDQVSGGKGHGGGRHGTAARESRYCM